MRKEQLPILLSISEEDFWNKLRELIREELHSAKPDDEPPSLYSVSGLIQKPVYKAYEICRLLNVTRQTLHEWAKEGILIPKKIKSRSYYLWSDIERLLKNDA